MKLYNLLLESYSVTIEKALKKEYEAFATTTLSSNSDGYFIKRGDKVVGGFELKLSDKFTGKLSFILLDFDVFEEFRGMGIGTKVLRILKQTLDKDIILSTDESGRAYQLYKREGFEVISRKDDFVLMIYKK